MYDFTGKHYLIVGASSGIGKDIAQYLTENCGANVILVARRQNIISKMANELHGENYAIPYDLEDIGNIKNIFEACYDNGIKLDGMVYSAGIAPLFSIADNDTRMMERVMKVNALAFAELGKYMLDNKYVHTDASVVAISSIVSIATTNRQSAYAVSKSMLNTYVRFLAKEGLGKLRANALLPGVVETEMYMQLKEQSPNLDEKTQKAQALGIIPVSKVSKLISFLLSDDASYITGSLINMDAGYMLK